MFFTKLIEYIGENIRFLIDRQDEPYVFRLVRDRVYYMSERIMKLCSNIGKDELLEAGVLFGKFTKGGKFRLSITCLDYLAKYARHRVWIKNNGEMPFLYGNHVLKNHIGRMTEDIPQYAGVIIVNMSDVALGFGVASRGTLQTKDLEPTAVVILNQADVGEYLRTEDN